MKQDNHTAYTETCNIIRHYSTASMTIRIVSIVQGIIILGGWIASKGNNQQYSIMFPIFGIVFTFLLYKFHLGYYDATAYFYKLASSMESKLFGDEFRPFLSYKLIHSERYNGFWNKLLIINAPFTLIGISYISAITIEVINWT